MTADLIEQLRRERVARGLTQRDVGAALATTQSAVARLESGRVSPKLTTVQAYSVAVGCDIGVVRPDLVASTAATIRECLAAGDADGALRALIQLHDDLLRPETPCAALMREPESCGARTWDAALAACVERAARRRGWPVPGWTAAPSRFLDGPWFPLEDIVGRPVPGLACLALAASPAEFAARGVHLDPATFDSR